MTHVKVRRHSKIDALPEEIQADVRRLLIEPDTTYEDIQEFLKSKGYEISHSSVGRYGKEFMNQIRRLRIVEEKSKELISGPGDGLVLEEAASKLFAEKIITALLDEGFNVKKLSYMLTDFARLQMASVRREALKAELKGKVLKAAEDVAKVAKKNGLSERAAEDIRKKILGIAK